MLVFTYDKIKSDDFPVRETITILRRLMLLASRKNVIKDIRSIFEYLPNIMQRVRLRDIDIYLTTVGTLFEIANTTSNEKVKKNTYYSIWLIATRRIVWRNGDDEVVKKHLLNEAKKTDINLFLQCNNPEADIDDVTIGENAYFAVTLNSPENRVLKQLRKYVIEITQNSTTT